MVVAPPINASIMTAYIKAIEFFVPQEILTNEDLVKTYPEWSIDKIEAKTGIKKRHIARANECASDLGVEAAKKLFSSGICKKDEIDHLIFCTQSPDYFLPTTACLIQDRLNLPINCGALDINLGCSGYVYGLGLAKGLIETGQCRNVLFITSETYSKFINPGDKSVRTLFGDGAAATLITDNNIQRKDLIGPFIYGTDGSGANNLIVPQGGMRCPRIDSKEEALIQDKSGNVRTAKNLFMDGSEIFTFTLKRVPNTISSLLEKTGKDIKDIDHFIFHQANKFMLEHLRKKIKIPPEKFHLAYQNFGNTVSSSIPIAIKIGLNSGRIKSGDSIVLVGFGVGYSWGATIVKWSSL